NITIDGFTIDGDNTSLVSGVNFNGANPDASEGIAAFDGVDHILVQNNIVKNTTYTGLDFDNYNNPTPTSDNLITHNLIQNLGGGGYGYGLGVLIQDNFYANITENKMDTVRLGVQTGNFFNANPDQANHPGSISNNDIAAYRAGVFFNLHYANASPFSISGNTITAVADPDLSVVRWHGVALLSQETTASVDVSNNTINGAGTGVTSAGYYVWNTPTSGAITISGGTVSNVDYGVRLT